MSERTKMWIVIVFLTLLGFGVVYTVMDTRCTNQGFVNAEHTTCVKTYFGLEK